jgi:hypothetical protein
MEFRSAARRLERISELPDQIDGGAVNVPRQLGLIYAQTPAAELLRRPPE